MARYASDKPDLRYGLEIADITDIAAKDRVRRVQNVIAGGGVIESSLRRAAVNIPAISSKNLNQLATSAGAKGLLTISLGAPGGSLDTLTQDMVKSVAAKFMTLEQVKEMAERCKANKGDLLLIVAGEPDKIYPALDALRREIARRLKLADPNTLIFAFIIDFPLISAIRKRALGSGQ